MNKRRIVVTGMGAVTPLGNTVQESWAAIRNKESGIDKISLFDASNYPVQIAAEVKNFLPEEHGIESREARRMARFTQFLLSASYEAIRDAGLSKETLEAECTGIMVGNGLSGFDVIEHAYDKYFNNGPHRVPPLAVPMFIANEGAANVSMKLGITGPSWTLATACASGTDALGAALDLIRAGRMDVCLAGGAESSITGFSISSFHGMHALAHSFNENPKAACRPFDKDREGFIMGEGAGILVLEELEHAKARGAKIYAEFAGYGASSDAYHITSPHPDGLGGATAIQRALEDAKMTPEEIDYYNAHGTSTKLNDAAETRMLKIAFGEYAKTLKISSTKSMTGHCIGAAGAVEAIISIKGMLEGFYPPTLNLENPDIEQGCDLNYLPEPLEAPMNSFVSMSLGFGGHNGAIVMKKFKD
jgi:3-oxoacyl-[acyl-carrier-protein] synthase II